MGDLALKAQTAIKLCLAGDMLTASAVTPKTPRLRPPAKAFNRSKYGEATVIRRLPLSILPAVGRLITCKLTKADAGDSDVWESR